MTVHSFEDHAATSAPQTHSPEILCITDAVLDSLGLTHGSQLVGVLPIPKARDNREALAGWIAQEMASPNLALAQACVGILVPELLGRLGWTDENHNAAYH